MAEPLYMNENRYTYLVGSWQRPASSVYVVQNPENDFEEHLQELFLNGQSHLQQEEHTLALQSFQEAMALILRTVHPTVPLDPGLIGKFRFPLDRSLLDSLVAQTATILGKTPPRTYALPASLVSDHSTLPAPAQQLLKPIATSGLQVTSFHGAVQTSVETGLTAAAAGDWKRAVTSFQAALDATPAAELAIRGGLQHDLAVLSEKAGDPAKAQALGQASVDSFTAAKLPDGQAEALATASGIFTRAGNTQRAADLSKQLDTVRSTHILNAVTAAPVDFSPQRVTARAPLTRFTSRFTTVGSAAAPASLAATAAQVRTPVLDPGAPELIGNRFVVTATAQKSLTIQGLATSATIQLDANAAASTSTFLKTLSTTKDVNLLTNWLSAVQFVAYIPHLYFFVLPMSIGDCYAGMGNLEDARQSYASVLAYPFLNPTYEVVKVWTRLAQTFVDLGDQAYRNAKDDAAGYAAARAFYENVVRADKTLNAGSPLYADAKFAAIKGRVTAFLAAADPTRVNDNPAVLSLVLGALAKLRQIAAGLNFFGFGADYVPPFSFEYLQSTARYFAEHAAQTEQRYIQYKSAGENEEFRREQLNQQAEVARQSVILEQRGAAEAQRGIEVANASQAYAANQVQSAGASLQDFNRTRNEFLELSSLEAWANASAVDRDDQVKLTISGYQYYSADHQRRNVVLQQLATQRTRLSQDLEAARLGRAVDSAKAYQKVAQAQVAEAQARLAIAQQRIQIAQLQQRQAEESRDFLDMQEFSSRLWYELACQAKRLKQRYLDMATEAAFLMERAYNAETERGLSVIRYDYQSTAAGNLMGADFLLADIDSFTFDYVTTTKTKKIPVKKTISLADTHPTQFYQLQATGACSFDTTFADFDRQHPGLYLAKIRNVELLLVGLGGLGSVAGTLRNLGVSRFRTAGGAVVERLYPADVMVLSQYEIRQDTLAFRFNPNDLRLFENNGIETLWRLELPLDANDFDLAEILDVQLVLYYDGFFDRTLETAVRGALPASGSASRSTSLKFSAPDELFYLRNQGEAELTFDATLFPRSQKNLKRTRDSLKVTGPAAKGLTLRLTAGATAAAGGEIVLTTDDRGEVRDAAGSPLAALQGKDVLDRWRFAVRAEDNPQLVKDGVLDLSGIDDLMVFFEYQFDYR
jgi:receptor-binding and translocation channel-forming TcA subunit of Tc toxin